MRVCIIPARGGSKRIPKKNIKFFCGKPMIAWSIRSAIESSCFDRVIVSTDDEGIAKVAREYGADTPFDRPANLSDDFVGTIPVIAHAISWLIEEGSTPDEVCCVYATAPFVRPSDLRSGLSMLQSLEVDYAFSVTSYAYPIQRAIRITSNERVEMFEPSQLNIRSQDLEDSWHDAGQFYWGRANAWLAGKPIFSHNSIPVKLPRHLVQDIDTHEDWQRAELMFKAMPHFHY